MHRQEYARQGAGWALDGGHYLAEKKPEETLSEIKDFLSAF
jgi:hypothetical protein